MNETLRYASVYRYRHKPTSALAKKAHYTQITYKSYIHKHTQFLADVKHVHLDAAVGDLASSISSLSSAVSSCNVPEVTGKLDALAAAIKVCV